ncbi:hypothetical protein [Gemella morbillorum]
MPNWCEGYLKIRGKKKDLINFIENEIVLIKQESIISEPQYIDVKMQDDGIDCSFKYNKSFKEFLYLKGTRRFFIESEEIAFYYGYDEDEVCYLTLNIKQAWGIDIQSLLVEHSKKYSVDFNIFASECGMEFEQYITVVGGKLLRNEERDYTDFRFEAINPDLGG